MDPCTWLFEPRAPEVGNREYRVGKRISLGRESTYRAIHSVEADPESRGI